jgi:hypothetical protein
MLMTNQPLSIYSAYAYDISKLDLRDISKCRSLYRSLIQCESLSTLTDSLYHEPLEYICADISINSLKYKINIIKNRNLESYIETH